jgi:MFS family permease
VPWGGSKVLLDLSPLRKHRVFRFSGWTRNVRRRGAAVVIAALLPSHLRGRMAAIEQLSYMTGPLLGNARAGFMKERFGLARSIVMGGVVCVAGVLACVPLLPAFWQYRRSETSAAEGAAAP